MDVLCMQICHPLAKTLHLPVYKELIKLLVEGRITAGITQHQLALRLSVPQSFVAKYELGERRIDVIEFIKISDALGINPSSIIEKLRVKNEYK